MFNARYAVATAHIESLFYVQKVSFVEGLVVHSLCESDVYLRLFDLIGETWSIAEELAMNGE